MIPAAMIRTLSIIAAIMLALPARAEAPKAFPDVFFDRCEESNAQICPSQKDRLTYGSLGVVECWVGRSFLDQSQRRYLQFARERLRMKGYSESLCVGLGVVPDDVTRRAVSH